VFLRAGFQDVDVDGEVNDHPPDSGILDRELIFRVFGQSVVAVDRLTEVLS
jgi:hypothetical protein